MDLLFASHYKEGTLDFPMLICTVYLVANQWFPLVKDQCEE